MTTTIRGALFALSLVTLGLANIACPDKGPAEKAGEKIDDAVDEAKDAAEDAKDAAKDAVDDAKDAVK